MGIVNDIVMFCENLFARGEPPIPFWQPQLYPTNYKSKTDIKSTGPALWRSELIVGLHLGEESLAVVVRLISATWSPATWESGVRKRPLPHGRV